MKNCTPFLKPLIILIMVLMYFDSHAQFSNNAPCAERPTNGIEFNWRATTFQCYVTGYPSNSIESPFHANLLRNQNIENFAVSTVKDYDPTEGWTYLQHNMGSLSQPISHPYFVLYNKHTGILRVFIAITSLFGQNQGATIKLQYASGSYRSAVLSTYIADRFIAAVDNFTDSVRPAIVENYFDSSPPYWLHADFNLTYDPCVCNFNNSLFLEASLTSTGNLSFTVDGTAIPYLDTKGRAGADGSQSIIDGIFTPGTAFWKDVDKGIKIINDIKSLPPPEPDTEWSTFITGLGKAMGAVDFLLGIFGLNKPKSSMPLSYKLNMKGTGTLTYNNPYRGIPMVTPGSAQVGIVNTAIPFYNNTPGFFNLLKSPKVKRYFHNRTQGNRQYRIRSYTLMEDFKYVINPTAGLSSDPNDIKITAQYVFLEKDKTYEEIASPEYSLACFKQLTWKHIFFRAKDPDRPNGWDPWDTEENGKMFIKIRAKFKAIPSNQDVIFTAIYLPDEIGEQAADNTLIVSQDPAPGCPAYLSPATSADIQAVCQSTQYQNKAAILGFAVATPVTFLAQEKTGSSMIVMSPNPGNGQFNLTLDADRAETVGMTILNAAGAQVYKNSITLRPGRNVLPAQVNLPSGIYLVQVTGSTKLYTGKLIIR